MTKLHTHYDNLKVSRDAPAGVIKAAYRALAQEHHPDRNKAPDATRKLQIINDAYAILSDPAERAKHDKWITANEKVPAPSPKAAPKPEPKLSPATQLYVEKVHAAYRNHIQKLNKAHSVELSALRKHHQWEKKFGILIGLMLAIPIFVIFATVDSAVNKSHPQQYQEANMRRN